MIGVDKYPGIARWTSTLERRRAVARALVATCRPGNEPARGLEAAPDERDRVFGRSRLSRV